MELYSLKMRASKSAANQKTQHISGAEKIISKSELTEQAKMLIDRALQHSKGNPDFINLKIEKVFPEEIMYVNALSVRTIETKTAAEGRTEILKLLQKIGIKNAADVLRFFKNTYNMRGAMLLNVDTLERLEPDRERGVRTTYMDSADSSIICENASKNHFREAIVLASKVVNAPNIIAEVCVSDDPDYVTGYVAAPSIGYVRITKLKEIGDPNGGRIFLYRGDNCNENVQKTIHYLEQQKVIVRNVPINPSDNADHKIDESQKNSKWKIITENLNNRKESGLYRTMTRIDSAQSSHVVVNNRRMLMLASNSYLGLTDDPRVKKAAQDAIEKYGAGSGGSRLTTGNLILHEELETALVHFKNTEAALIFNTGYMANVGILSAFGSLFKKQNAVIFSDELNHASIIDGCRLSNMRVVIYNHNDMEDLETKIQNTSPANGIIVTDAVFSMDGDIANLPKIIWLSKKYNLFSMVDEAHATGVIGKTGHGIVEYFDLNEQPDIIMGTMSKALASEGGFVCGNQFLIDFLRNAARSFIFSTSLAPATLAAAKKSLEIICTEPEKIKKLQENTKFFVNALKKQGIEAKSESAIVPIIIGDEIKSLKIAEKLFAEGIFISAIRYPSVALGKARLRAAIMSTHTEEELQYAAEKIACAINEIL